MLIIYKSCSLYNFSYSFVNAFLFSNVKDKIKGNIKFVPMHFMKAYREIGVFSRVLNLTS
jgi:hypothetical protein